MKFYKFWASDSAKVTPPNNARSWHIKCFGWSDTSIADAARQAAEKAQRVSAIFGGGNVPNQYAYAERPLREEMVEEIKHQDRLVAAITRNSYGSLILNATHAMFIDIDNPTGTSLSAVKQRMGRLFGGGARQDKGVADHIDQIVNGIPGLGLRLYRTSNGHRCLVTSAPYDPTSSDALQLLERFSCDPLYIKLCKSQACFRARVSPKFWRCGGSRPPSRFPWTDRAEEHQYRTWQSLYQEQAKRYSTCHHVASFGNERVHDTLPEIVATHDKLACTPAAELA